MPSAQPQPRQISLPPSVQMTLEERIKERGTTAVALELIEEAKQFVGHDRNREANLAFYDRLGNQVRGGTRSVYTLCMTIDGVKGMPDSIGQALGLSTLNQPINAQSSGRFATGHI